MSTYERHSTYSVDEVLSKVGVEKKDTPHFAVFNGQVVRMTSARYRLFKEKGTVCVNCGVEGTFFALERHRHGNETAYHFNLYGHNSNGHEVMLTKDHIIPRSKGGKNHVSNYNPMCHKCNQKKGNKLKQE